MKIFKYRHFGIQGPVFRNIADFAECGDSVFGNVHAVDGCFAAVGRQIAGQQAHQRGFAGAVRAEQRDNLAFFDAKVNIVDGFYFIKAFRQVPGDYHGFGRFLKFMLPLY